MAGQEVAARRVEQLQVALSTKVTPEMLTGNVRTKPTHVERLEHSYLNQKMEAAATRIELAPDAIADALEIASLRNMALSHPGREATQAINVIVVKAERAARAFLNAVIATRMG